MTLLNAPAYDAHKEKLKNVLLIGSLATVVLLVLLTLVGFLLGHGWLFTNLPAEHTVNQFFVDLEAKDFDKAYAIYTHDADWKQHADQHKDYPIDRFTEDWTYQSPVGGPIVSHHVDISKTDGSGTFGTGIIVAVRAKADGKPEKKIFMWYQKSDHTLTEPAPHILEY